MFVAFFSFGPGVCVWVVAAELLPASVRAKGMSFALLGNQAVTAAIASVFLPVASRFGYAPLSSPSPSPPPRISRWRA